MYLLSTIQAAAANPLVNSFSCLYYITSFISLFGLISNLTYAVAMQAFSTYNIPLLVAMC